MGDDVHILRNKEWLDEEEEISLDEWKRYVNVSSDMRLDGFVEADTPNGTLQAEREELSYLFQYSDHEVDGNTAWFDHFEGTIKNPNEEIQKNMYQIAQALNTKVQSDKYKAYNRNGKSDWQKLKAQAKSVRTSCAKKWWQFWR